MTVRVRNKATLTDDAREALSELRKDVTEAAELSAGQRRKLVVKLDTADKKLARAQEYADDGTESKADTQLTVSINTVGAFINALTAGADTSKNGDLEKEKRKGPPIPARYRVGLRRRAELLIDTIDTARRADT